MDTTLIFDLNSVQWNIYEKLCSAQGVNPHENIINFLNKFVKDSLIGLQLKISKNPEIFPMKTIELFHKLRDEKINEYMSKYNLTITDLDEQSKLKLLRKAIEESK